MKKEDSDILSKLGKDAGFKVPENYFENFASKMADSLPERKPAPVIKLSTWQRIRPYVYMAAMFAGIWCMMKVFTGFKGSPSKTKYNPDIVAGFQNNENVDDFMLRGDVSEYDIMSYEDSVAAQDSTAASDIPQDIQK
jgi:hypothetical protein